MTDLDQRTQTAESAAPGADRLKIVAVVPFLNEEQHLPVFLESVAAQTRRLDKLILVDDGSTDRSGAIAAAFADANPYAVALTRPPRPPRRDRLATADEWKAFLWGVEHIDSAWDVLAKLDGDLKLNPTTAAEIERQLILDPRLGLAGSYLSEDDGSGRVVRLRIRPSHAHGATKFYRRACWEQISPVPPLIGWDTLDEVRARLAGWRTQSFAMPGGDPLHLRPRGSYDGVARGLRRWGSSSWALGHHPLHVLLFSIRDIGRDAGPLGALNYLVGWAGAAMRRSLRADPAVRAYIRRDELQRIRRRALELLQRPRAGASEA